MLDNQTLESLGRQVALACEGEADFDDTLAALQAAIDVHPSEPRLLRLRAELHGAAYMQVQAWQDWRRVVELAPDDRDAQLELARRQCRWAHHIASALDTQEDEDDEPEESDDGAVDRIEEEGRAQFEHLMRRHATDAGFAQAVLQAWDEGAGWQPWRHYTLLQLALAAHPRHRALRKAEARFLASLAGATFGDHEQIPPGHFTDAMGTMYHTFTVEQALAAVQALLDEGEDADLLSARADLLVAIDDHAGAAEAYRQLGRLCERLAQAEADDEQREALVQQRDAALAQAEACSGGRAGYVAAQMATLGASMGQLDAMRLRFDEGDDSLAELKSNFSQWQEAVVHAPDVPSPEQHAQLLEVVHKVAGSVVGTLSFDEIVLQPLRDHDLAGGPSAWFAEMAPSLSALGLTLRALFENPANTRALGVQVQGQLWTDADGSTAVVLETAKHIRLRRVFSELGDGRLLLSADSRLSGFFSAGQRVEVLSLDPGVSMQQMLALHRASLQRRLSEGGCQAKPVDSLARLAELENAMRLSKNDHRLATGISDTELRGMHAQFPQVFAALMRAEVNTRLAALRSTAG